MTNLLNGLKDPKHSTVMTGNDGCTSNFINIRHKYDPFTWFKTYDRKMDNKVTFINLTVRKYNTHDFYEYLPEPKAGRSIISFIYEVMIDDDKYDEAVNIIKVI
jgi:hypothetical protein